MKEVLELLIHFIVTLCKLSGPGGVKTLVAENHALRQQLVVIRRSNKRSPRLKSSDRFLFGFFAFFISDVRLRRIAIIVKPSTILSFHRALVKRKYSRLYSNRAVKKSGRKPPDQSIVDLIVDMKKRNPSIGYGRIAMQVYETFGIEISRFAVGRILRKNADKLPSGDGPSWLTFIGHMKDSLWSRDVGPFDLFRCESVALNSHWVMVVIDQFSRRIIGYAVHAGSCDGAAYCRMFNQIISGKALPKYLSSDNDPLFLFHRWQANLRILEIEEIKSIPGTPTSHPFIERVIRTTRNEFLDHVLFFNKYDLQRKLEGYQDYYNDTRAHSSLAMKTPSEMATAGVPGKAVTSLDDYRWRSHCSGLYTLPIAA